MLEVKTSFISRDAIHSITLVISQPSSVYCSVKRSGFSWNMHSRIIMPGWVMLALKSQPAPFNTAATSKTWSSKVCKSNILVYSCTLPRLSNVSWNALKSDVQSKYRLSHSRQRSHKATPDTLQMWERSGSERIKVKRGRREWKEGSE